MLWLKQGLGVVPVLPLLPPASPHEEVFKHFQVPLGFHRAQYETPDRFTSVLANWNPGLCLGLTWGRVDGAGAGPTRSPPLPSILLLQNCIWNRISVYIGLPHPQHFFTKKKKKTHHKLKVSFSERQSWCFKPLSIVFPSGPWGSLLVRGEGVFVPGQYHWIVGTVRQLLTKCLLCGLACSRLPLNLKAEKRSGTREQPWTSVPGPLATGLGHCSYFCRCFWFVTGCVLPPIHSTSVFEP